MPRRPIHSAFPFLAQRLFNVPQAIAPAKAELIVAVLAERLGIASFQNAGRIVALGGDEGSWSDGEDWGGNRRSGEYDVAEGIAVISVHGTLVQRSASLRPESGMTGYNAIGANLMAALEDDAVRGILLDIDSPGGEVAGCFDLADAIFEARGDKPIWAALNEAGYSAAYALAAACDRVTLPRTGGAGSIGVLCMHVDWSRAIGQAGLAVTFVQHGSRKSDGAPEKPLSKGALADIQDKVDRAGNLFVDSVARYRGVRRSVIRDQEAGTFMGEAAVIAKLADAVMPIDEAFAELSRRVNSGRSPSDGAYARGRVVDLERSGRRAIRARRR